MLFNSFSIGNNLLLCRCFYIWLKRGFIVTNSQLLYSCHFLFYNSIVIITKTSELLQYIACLLWNNTFLTTNSLLGIIKDLCFDNLRPLSNPYQPIHHSHFTHNQKKTNLKNHLATPKRSTQKKAHTHQVPINHVDTHISSTHLVCCYNIYERTIIEIAAVFYTIIHLNTKPILLYAIWWLSRSVIVISMRIWDIILSEHQMKFGSCLWIFFISKSLVVLSFLWVMITNNEFRRYLLTNTKSQFWLQLPKLHSKAAI